MVELITSIQQREFGVAITVEEQPDLLNIKTFYQAGKGNFWVALSDSRVVGTVALLDLKNGLGALRKMFVEPDYRGNETGIAILLLDTLFEWARANHYQEIYLGTTPKFLAAHRFYEKNGFLLVEQDDLPEAFPVMKVDTRFYKISP